MIDIAEAARRLIAARASREPIPRLPVSCRPLTDEDAYAIQDEITKVLGPVGGWKVGRGAPDADPIFAPIYQDMIHGHGAVLAAEDLPRRLVEVEAGFVFMRDWSSDAGASPLRFVPVIEIVNFRHAAPGNTPRAELLADAFGNAGAAVAEPSSSEDMDPPARGPVMVQIDDDDIATVSMKYPMADLRRLAAWLCDELVRRGQRPRAGHFITTGAIVGPVRAERRVSADWGPHGALAISFG